MSLTSPAVKVRADAIEVDGPLPGGGSGDTAVVIEPMRAGTAVQPPGLFERGPGTIRAGLRAAGVGVSREDYARLPVPAFLVHHPTAGLVLIDTGLHPSVANDPRDNLGRILGKYFELEVGTDVPSRLRDRGLRPADVSYVILTHMHVDHTSALASFPDATVVVSKQEWEKATRAPRLRDGYRRQVFDHAFDFCTVDFDADFISSHGPFPRTFDVFGDGTIRMVFTPGHSPGHCSVICALPRREFVVLGDAAYFWKQIEGHGEPYQVDDLHNWRRSLKELNAYRDAFPYSIVVPSHDGEFFAKLDSRYEE